ncbi:type VI secretion system tube protein Hcp [Chloroflexota bacterium]
MKSRFFIFTLVILLVVVTAGVFNALGQSNMAPASAAEQELIKAPVMTNSVADGSEDPMFVKYDGIDGEAIDADHDKWIDVLSIKWGASRPTVGASGRTRSEGLAMPNDMTFTFYYEKSAPKLLEKCAKGEMIPELEFEATTITGSATYLRYELKNVLVTSYDVSGDVESGVPPTVTVSNNFEEIKVTYTEINDDGSPGDSVETEWQVKKGIITGSTSTN